MRAIFPLLVLLAWGHGHAQLVGSVAGHVLDAQTNEPIINANVEVARLGAGSITDESGSYLISPLPPGVYEVEASHIAYRSQRCIIQISGGEIVQDFRLEPRILAAREVIITAQRATRGVTPVTFTDISEAELVRERSVEDVPMLLQDLVPGVYAYSDAGNGVGYSYLKIRGFDQKRVNVMINGIPLNDPEDHQVYWVDMPELSSSLRDIQVQRGVGTALSGQHGLGGSVNMSTIALPGEPGFHLSSGMGSWGTRRFTFSLTSASSQNRSMYARFSRVLSDGYRDRTDSDLWSYFLAAQAIKENKIIRFNAYGGPIKSHAGWYAAHEDSLAKNRKFNPVAYHNEIDSFNQPHYELHFSMTPSERMTIGSSLFYIRGRGYYEQFKYNKKLRDYGVVPATDDSTRADLIRQKEVKKDQVGWISRTDLSGSWVDVSLGSELSYYRSTHWGELLWTEYADTVRGDYYRYKGQKLNLSAFVHLLTHLGSRVDIMSDVAVQMKKYHFQQEEEGNFQGVELNRFDDDFTFFSPRLGVTFRPINGLSAYVNVSKAYREPADDDYFDVWDGPDDLLVDPLFTTADTVRSGQGEVKYIEWWDPQVEPEELTDYESGIQFRKGDFEAGIALYLMQFKNEIVPYGRFDQDRGAPVTGNAPKTEHRGIELSLRLPPLRLPRGEILLAATGSFSKNELKEFTSYESWDEEGEDLSGNPIPLFPERLMNTTLAYQLSPLVIGLRFKSVGRQYLDTSGKDDRTIDDHTLADGWIRVGPFLIHGLGRATLEFRVDNLTDKLYETSGYYDSWEGARYYWPGAERTFYAGIKLDL